MENFPTDEELDAILTGLPTTSIYPDWEAGIGVESTIPTDGVMQYGGSSFEDPML